jgi:hypothetical protein
VNPLQKLQVAAGQKAHELFYGARLSIFGQNIPCASTKIEKDFDLVPGGKSPLTVVKAITFRKSLLGANIPAKGVRCELFLTEEATGVRLQLWAGGPLPGDEVYQFMAVDANYKA